MPNLLRVTEETDSNIFGYLDILRVFKGLVRVVGIELVEDSHRSRRRNERLSREGAPVVPSAAMIPARKGLTRFLWIWQ